MKIANEMVSDIRQDKANDPIEKCVICGAETPYRFSTPVTQREFYVIGAGQICQRCYYEIYSKKKDD